jgi:hypothetical protein
MLIIIYPTVVYDVNLLTLLSQSRGMFVNTV